MDSAEQLATIEHQHRDRGYHESVNGHGLAYHFFIGTDGTLVQTRSIHERSGHTRNQEVNLSSISIALAGNFTDKMPDDRQIETLTTLIGDLKQVVGDVTVKGHRHASATACPGEKFDRWIERTYGNGYYVSVSRYYTPVPDQEYYYRSYEGEELVKEAIKHRILVFDNDAVRFYNRLVIGSYHIKGFPNMDSVREVMKHDSYFLNALKKNTEFKADFSINCAGDCFSAGGHRLTQDQAGHVAACPDKYPKGTKFDIDGIGEVTCVDRGGAIISKEECEDRGGENCFDRIDLWMGSGTDAIDLIRSTVGGVRRATIL